MKFSLKIIILIVSLVMLGIFLYQLYWLNNLYKTSSLQFEKNVYEAMDIADQKELLLQIEKAKDLASDPSIAMSVGMEKGDSIGQEVFYAQDIQKKDTVNKTGTDSVGFNDFKENIKTTEKLAAYIKKTMHMSVDPIVPVDIQLYDSLLSVELEKENITQPFRVFLVKTENDSICLSGINRHNFNIKNASKYDFLYDMYGSHAYRLYLKNPNAQVLAQMAGILLTSVVIFIILIYTFIYLLKTIRKLQTEEELKTNFTNNMTHELKTPIAVSYAAIDALTIADHPISEERQKKYLNIAKEQMAHLSGLVEQILNMSRKDNRHIELKIEQVDLNEIVAALTEKLKLLSEKEIVVETSFTASTIKADKLHLTNILNNLMENGIKYSEDSVHLKITSFFLKPKSIAISIEDNGIGIDPKYQSKLFDKFYRIPTGNKHDVKGFGLGLFYVKEMIEKHNGTVEVKSQSGKGSIFTIKIPQ